MKSSLLDARRNVTGNIKDTNYYFLNENCVCIFYIHKGHKHPLTPLLESAFSPIPHL